MTSSTYTINRLPNFLIPKAVDPQNPITRSLGQKQYELSNHLGNVLVTVSDRKLAEGTEGTTATGYRAEVLFASDYYPFGMQMPGMEFSQEEYRYGFQGQETDKEWLGGAVSFKYRVHDARIGRFFAVDPLTSKYPHYTPYSFSGNKVIAYKELEGLEEMSIHVTEWIDSEGNTQRNKSVSYNNQQGLGDTGFFFSQTMADGTVYSYFMPAIEIVGEIEVAEEVSKSDQSTSTRFLRFDDDKIWVNGKLVYDERDFIGHYDGANMGGEYSGKDGMVKAGPVVAYTVATIISGGTLVAAEGIAVVGSSVSFIFTADQLVGEGVQGSDDNPGDTLLAKAAYSLGEEKGLEFFEGAQVGVAFIGGVKGLVSIKGQLLSGETFSFTLETIDNAYSIVDGSLTFNEQTKSE